MAPADGKDETPPPRPPPAARPALPDGREKYMRHSILASLEGRHRRLRDRVFALQADLHAAARRIDLLRNESAMNAEEKEAMAAARDQLAADAARLEKDLERAMEEKEAMAAARDQLAAHAARLEEEKDAAIESCDELARESDELRKRLRDAPDVTALNNEVEALQRDKEILVSNLNKAEEEVELLFKENWFLNETNKRLLCLLEKERKR